MLCTVTLATFQRRLVVVGSELSSFRTSHGHAHLRAREGMWAIESENRTGICVEARPHTYSPATEEPTLTAPKDSHISNDSPRCMIATSSRYTSIDKLAHVPSLLVNYGLSNTSITTRSPARSLLELRLVHQAVLQLKGNGVDLARPCGETCWRRFG